MHAKIRLRSLKGREDLGVDERIILKFVREKYEMM
jgi:hypothetical protein